MIIPKTTFEEYGIILWTYCTNKTRCNFHFPWLHIAVLLYRAYWRENRFGTIKWKKRPEQQRKRANSQLCIFVFRIFSKYLPFLITIRDAIFWLIQAQFCPALWRDKITSTMVSKKIVRNFLTAIFEYLTFRNAFLLANSLEQCHYFGNFRKQFLTAWLCSWVAC